LITLMSFNSSAAVSAQYPPSVQYQECNGEEYFAGDGRSLETLRHLGKNGNADAQFQLGRMFQSGAVVKKSAQQSRWWYEQAAKQDHPGALFYLSCNSLIKAFDQYTSYGHGSLQRGVELMFKSFSLGNMGAITTLEFIREVLIVDYVSRYNNQSECFNQIVNFVEVPYTQCLVKMYKDIAKYDQGASMNDNRNEVAHYYGLSQLNEELSMTVQYSKTEVLSYAVPRVETTQVESGERYSPIVSNGFKSSTDEPLSTFSIDVDTASYAHMRRYLQQYDGLPPINAIRIEELINYFTYDYPQPEGDDPFSVTTEISTAPWNPEHQLVHIGLQGRELNLDKAPASNLVFLIDTSGSMSDDIVLVKQALKMLVGELRDDDSISIVTYAGSAGLALPATKGSDKDTILRAIDNMNAGGSTAGGAGIELAYKIAKQNFIFDGNNRVILASDGDFNVGVSSREGLVTLIESKRDERIFLSALGFGYANYADELMEPLANHGNGNYHYIDNLLEAKKVLVKEMGGTLYTIAKDVKIQVEFNPEKVKAYRLIGYENRLLNKEDFNDDKKDAGELGAGHTVTALYEIIPVGVDTPAGDVDELKYQQTTNTNAAKTSDEMMTVKLRYKEPTGNTSKLIEVLVKDAQVAFEESSDNFRFSSAVAALGMELRGSEHKGSITFKQIQEIAKNAKGKDLEGYRAEFVRLVELAEIFMNSK